MRTKLLWTTLALGVVANAARANPDPMQFAIYIAADGVAVGAT